MFPWGARRLSEVGKRIGESHPRQSKQHVQRPLDRGKHEGHQELKDIKGEAPQSEVGRGAEGRPGLGG